MSTDTTALVSTGQRELSGRVAVITGAGSGIGAATARVLAGAGAAVVAAGRRFDPLEAVCGGIRQAGGDAIAVSADVSAWDDAERIAEVAKREFGRVDVLVNNAGLHSRWHRFHEVPVEEFDEIIAVDLRGPFLMMKAIVPLMLRNDGGSVVNVSSMAGMVGVKHCASYCAAKGGLIQLSRSAALDYADQGVRVYALCPGGTSDTEAGKQLGPGEWELMMEAVQNSSSALGRPATAVEVAETIRFLVGPHAAPLLGAVIPVDGGYTAR